MKPARAAELADAWDTVSQNDEALKVLLFVCFPSVPLTVKPSAGQGES